jgi:FkbM family methyltransferase
MTIVQHASHPNMAWLARSVAARNVDQLRANLSKHNSNLDPRVLREVAIVGFAPEGRRLAEICRTRGIKIAAIVDDDPAKIGTKADEIYIKPVDSLRDLPRTTPVVIASHRVLRATQRLRALGFKLVVPFAALQVLAPDFFAPHMFYDGLLDDLVVHRAQYTALNDKLADVRSRQVLDAVLGFRQTLDPVLLETVLKEDDLYAPEGLFEFGANETYLDAGTFDGDTIRSFIGRVSGRFDHIYGFEPDPVTFEKLKANFASEPRVHPIHAGIYSHKGSLRFHDDASRGAIFANDGEIEMPVTTIDEVLGDERVTYIKMNIEGAEIEALKGGRHVISKWLPRLAISVYHRPGDLWQIPEFVNELSPTYDLYLRQHDGGVIETVLYAVARKTNRNA